MNNHTPARKSRPDRKAKGNNRAREDNVTLYAALRALGHVDSDVVSVSTKGPGGTGRFTAETRTVESLRDWTPPGEENVWFSANPLRQLMPPGVRGGVADVVRGQTLYADLDVAIPGVKTKGLASIDDCEKVVAELAHALGVDPAVVIYSGHGVQPIWRVADAQPITDNAVAWNTISLRWSALVRQVVHRLSPEAVVDSVFNIDRILRCPGTVNWKEPQNPIPVRCSVNAEAAGIGIAVLDGLLPAMDNAGVTVPAVHAKASLAEGDVLFERFRGGAMSPAVVARVNRVVEAVEAGADRHKTMNDATMSLVRLGAKGERGVPAALSFVATAFEEVAAENGHDPEEFSRSLKGALRTVAGDPDCQAMDHDAGRAFGPEGLWGPGSRWTQLVVDGEQLWQRSRGPEPAPEPAKSAIFTLLGPADWAQAVPPPQFLVTGLVVRDTFGVVAGPKKSLKTHENHALALAVATGQPLYNHKEFEVPTPQSVLYIVGEGGQGDVQRKLQRMCRTYGVDPVEVARDPRFPLQVAFGSAPMSDPRFADELKAMLDRVQPGLVLIESFYNFHPVDVETGNLYQRGQAIDEFHKSVRRESAGATSLMTDHYRSTARKGNDLDMIAMAGQAEVADSWITRYHRAEPDVENGLFRLRVDFGSRQWGGRELDIDWDLGRFDPETGSHVGGDGANGDHISWTIERSGQHDGDKAEAVTLGILKELWKTPGVHTKSELSRMVSGRNADVSKEIERLMEEGVVYEQPTPRAEGQRTVKRKLLFAKEAGFKVPGAGK